MQFFTLILLVVAHGHIVPKRVIDYDEKDYLELADNIGGQATQSSHALGDDFEKILAGDENVLWRSIFGA